MAGREEGDPAALVFGLEGRFFLRVGADRIGVSRGLGLRVVSGSSQPRHAGSSALARASPRKRVTAQGGVL